MRLDSVHDDNEGIMEVGRLIDLLYDVLQNAEHQTMCLVRLIRLYLIL
jgi:hypothetical protein